MDLPLADVPEPDVSLEPAGFMVAGEGGDRIHFLDWGGPSGATAPGAVAIHGLGQTAWIWTPVARRLGGPRGARRFVAMDLRGHGLSDAPTEDGAYDLDALASDVVAVADGSGLLDGPGHGIVLAGHGFGAIVAARAAVLLDDRCAGLVLVDGGWESIEAATGMEADEFLRGIDEPPEVLRSMSAFLADRRRFDPASWDADQETGRPGDRRRDPCRAGRAFDASARHSPRACGRCSPTTRRRPWPTSTRPCWP